MTAMGGTAALAQLFIDTVTTLLRARELLPQTKHPKTHPYFFFGLSSVPNITAPSIELFGCRLYSS